MLQLSDLVGIYPEASSEDFQSIISSKQEFASLSASISQEPVAEFFPHQLLLHRYMMRWHSAFIIDHPGVGKTAEFAGFTELAYRERLKWNESPETADQSLCYLKRTYILLKNDGAHRAEIKSQIVRYCSRGRFFEPRPNGKKSTKNYISNELKKWYTFITCGKFGRMIRSKFAKIQELPQASRKAALDKLLQEYSNSIYVFDEAHFMIVQKEMEEDVETKKDNINKTKTFDTIYGFLHMLTNCKKIIVTATPASGDITEIAQLTSLLLPRQKADALRNMSTEELENMAANDKATFSSYFGGMFFFVASLNEDITITNVVNPDAKPLNNKLTYRTKDYTPTNNIYISYMSGIQKSTYKRATENARGNIAMSIASDMVLPDGEIPINMEAAPETYMTSYDKIKMSFTPQMKEFLKKNNSSMLSHKNAVLQELAHIQNSRFDVGSRENALIEELTRIENSSSFDMLSCKNSTICRLIVENEGVHYVYGEHKNYGAVIRGLFLEYYTSKREDMSERFVQFDYSTSVFQDNGDVKPEFKTKKWRYVIMTGNNTSKYVNLAKTISCKENIDGGIIKVVFVTKAARESISFGNVRYEHMAGGEWTAAAETQLFGRGIRATSHALLLQREREEYVKRGLDPSTAKVNVSIYRHAAVNADDPGSSIDLYMYSAANTKGVSISAFLNKIKEICVTCHIHRERNLRALMNPSPFEWGKTPEDYRCFSSSPSNRDYSTYDIYYSGDELDYYEPFILPLLAETGAFVISDFNKHYPDVVVRDNIILNALKRVIVSKKVVRDRYGFSCLVKESDGFFYLVRSHLNNDGGYSASHYSSNLTVLDKKGISTVLEISVENEADRLYKEFSKNMNVYELRRALYPPPKKVGKNKNQGHQTQAEGQKLSKVKLLENAVIKYIKGDTSWATLNIMEFYRIFLHRIGKPLGYIQMINGSDVKIARGANRGKAVPTLAELNSNKLIDISESETKPPFYVHQLRALIFANGHGSKATWLNGTSTPTEPLRILDVNAVLEGRQEGVWRDVAPLEEAAYVLSTRTAVHNLLSVVVQNPRFGFILPSDGKFRIADKSIQEEVYVTKGGVTRQNKKKIKTGRVGSSHDKAWLVDVLYDFTIEDVKYALLDDSIRLYVSGSPQEYRQLIASMELDPNRGADYIRQVFYEAIFSDNFSMEPGLEIESRYLAYFGLDVLPELSRLLFAELYHKDTKVEDLDAKLLFIMEARNLVIR